MQTYINWVNDNCFTKKGIYNSNVSNILCWNKRNIILYSIIMEYTQFLDNPKFTERLYCFINKISSYNKCYCNKYIKTFISFPAGYRKFCSCKCSYNSQERLLQIKQHWKDDSTRKSHGKKISKTYKNKTKQEKEESNKKRQITREKWSKKHLTDIYSKVGKKNKYHMNKRFFTKELFEERFKHVNFKFNIDDLYNESIQDKKFEFECVYCKKIFKAFIHNGINPLCSCQKQTSLPEQQLLDFICSISNNVIHNDRKLISPLELDVVVPEKKVAFELNGIYWHSDNWFNKNYHLNKTEKCEEKGYQLFHILDTEWHDKQEIWKSVIRNALGVCNKKIGARQTLIKEVSTKESRYFLNDNHLQGYCNSSVKLGLYYKDELVSLMTFGKARFSKNHDWELMRFCSKNNWVIIGAASKLLKHFDINNEGSIVSYANRRWSKGNLYNELGFYFVHNSKPNYFYWKTGHENIKLESRNKYQKHKLEKLLPLFNKELTEAENMYINGYKRIWDAGNKVYKY